jgi:hypothetical protein
MLIGGSGGMEGCGRGRSLTSFLPGGPDPDPESGYRLLQAADHEIPATQFATHGRTALLPG